MKKGGYIFLNIITLGIFGAIVKSKAKKLASTTTNEFKVATSTGFDNEEFINKFGGQDNIVSAVSTLHSIKIVVKKPIELQKDDFESFGIKGFMKSNNIYTLILGDNASALAQHITQKIG